ncbi:hypothetical protein PENTCL1PPCAC_27858 [Pristionchus entomophagus]|uniref:Methylosome subunit pICln n=1 Tax=Pristionchus entomophagus TaxID=358040 RepID=A0AAV5UH48_9BILA|nr:hypothetical protein PENTCL1PPCAC_27858 [Pristionchus entomophagus]
MLVLGDVSIPEQGVRLIQEQVVAYLNDSPIAGEGTLAVTENSVTWISRGEARGFALSYPSIIMHAISTDISSFPHEHVLVVVDAGRADVQLAHQELQTGAGDEEGGEEESEGDQLILRFVPSDMSALDIIYKEMAECQELNPELEDMEEDEDEEEGEEGVTAEFDASGDLGPGWYTADNLDNVELSEEGRANLERMLGNARNGDHGTNGHHDNDEHEMEE